MKELGSKVTDTVTENLKKPTHFWDFFLNFGIWKS
jgi:hypothetical protein